MNRLGVLLAAGCMAAIGQAWAVEEEATPSRLTIDVGDAVTFGKFTAQDTTIDVKTKYANPFGGVELRLAGPFSVGGSYAQSKNEFDGDWSDGDKDGSGTLDAKRTDINAYVRIGYRDSVNLRLGYRYFKYEFSDGTIDQFKYGMLTEMDRHGSAEGEMTTGIDAELNLVFGDEVQFGLGIGATYYPDAKYTWAYDKKEGGRPWTHEVGSATVNSYSARIKPEITFKLSDEVRIFVNYTLQGTMWEGTPDSADDQNYPGIDIYSAAAAGIRIVL